MDENQLLKQCKTFTANNKYKNNRNLGKIEHIEALLLINFQSAIKTNDHDEAT